MKATDLMTEYLQLSAEERALFDRFYAEREAMQPILDLLAKATPEQLKRVREKLAKWRSGETSASDTNDHE